MASYEPYTTVRSNRRQKYWLTPAPKKADRCEVGQFLMWFERKVTEASVCGFSELLRRELASDKI